MFNDQSASIEEPASKPEQQQQQQQDDQQQQSQQARLFVHCDLGQYDEISALLRKRRGLFVNCVDAQGNTPLHVVRDLRCAELLLESGGGVSSGSGVQAVLNRQNRDGETPLMVCLRLGNEQLAGYYLDNGADIRAPNKHFQHCLHVAAHSGLAEMLDRLLGMRQLDPNQHDRMGNAVVHYAVAYGDKDRAVAMLARLLEESQLAVDAEDAVGRTAFALAAQSGNLAACRLLRDRGCDLCHADPNGADALHVAAAVDGADTLRYLVSDLAFSVDRPDKLGRTALFYAVHHAAEASVGELLALGADANWTDRCGRTPAHVAADKGLEACLLRLLGAGADPRLPDTRGQTPLHLAAESGQKAAVRRLLQGAGEDLVMARDVERKTARELALQNRHQQVADMLARAAPRQSTAPQTKTKDRQKDQQQQQQQQQEKQQQQQQKEQQQAKEEQKKKDKREAEQRDQQHRSTSYPRPVSASNAAPTSKAAASAEKEKRRKERSDRRQKEQEQAEAKRRQAEEEHERDDVVVTMVQQDVAEPEKGRRSPSPASSSSSSTAVAAVKSDTDSSSRPSSHLEEELHGDRRTREAEDRRDDPYLTAEPAWITTDDSHADSSKRQPRKQTAPQPQEQQQKRQQEHHKRRQPLLQNRSQKTSPNLTALRQRLYMYDSTVMLGRMLSEERRERMYLRGGVGPLPPASTTRHHHQGDWDNCQHKAGQSPRRRRRRPTRPSTAADADRLTDQYRDINRETRQLLDKWKQENLADSGASHSSRPISSRGSPSRHQSSSDRSVSAHRTDERPKSAAAPQPYQRPQSGSRFLDYFPNNSKHQGESSAGGAGGVANDDDAVGRSRRSRRGRRVRSRNRHDMRH